MQDEVKRPAVDANQSPFRRQLTAQTSNMVLSEPTELVEVTDLAATAVPEHLVIEHAGFLQTSEPRAIHDLPDTIQAPAAADTDEVERKTDSSSASQVESQLLLC